MIPGGKPIIKNGNLVDDDLCDGLGFVSEELDGMNQDNQGTVGPRHVRNFDFDASKKPLSGGLGRMIIENATSRIYRCGRTTASFSPKPEKLQTR